MHNDLLNSYAEKIMAWNEKINVTGAKSAEEFRSKHIDDVVKALTVYQPEGQTILDVGTGGGVPGVPIHILTGKKVILIDRRNKKTGVVHDVLQQLGLLENCRTMTGSFEELWRTIESTTKGSMEIWMRAFLPGPKLAVFLSEHFDPKHLPKIVLMKGPAWPDELAELLKEKKLSKGWAERFKNSRSVEYTLSPELGKRLLVIF